MRADLLRLELLVDRDGDDRYRTAEDTLSLLEQLRELDIEDARPLSSGAVPPGARGMDAVTVGSVVVTVAGSQVILKSLLSFLQDWLKYRDSGTVSIKCGARELHMTRVPRSLQQQSLDAFISDLVNAAHPDGAAATDATRRPDGPPASSGDIE
jgi:hypothetical protein